MAYKIVDRKLLNKIGILCPVCGSCKVTTRRKDNMRRCERCGEEWPRKPFVREEKE